MFRVVLVVSLIVAMRAPLALASDGELEINQACAVTGCFAGDAPGFPVTVGSSGSYRLTSNLTVDSASTTAIEITTSVVTLDLGGFQVKGPNTCSGYPVTSCSLVSGARGISSPTANEFLVSIHDGTVTGFGLTCLDLQGNSSTVERVATFFCGNNGIGVGFGGRVSASFSTNNAINGIQVGAGGSADGNEVRGNGGFGIVLGGSDPSSLGATFIGNRVTQNKLSGILAGPVGSATLVSRNLLKGNLGGAFGAVKSLGDNLCDGGVLC